MEPRRERREQAGKERSSFAEDAGGGRERTGEATDPASVVPQNRTEGALWSASKALAAASLALSLLPGRSRVKRVAGGLLGTAGAFALRFAVFQAGKASARDPRAAFHRQRRESGTGD